MMPNNNVSDRPLRDAVPPPRPEDRPSGHRKRHFRLRPAWSLPVLAIVLSLPPAAVALLNSDVPYLGSLDDDGIYAAVAQSLAGGQGYRIPCLPGNPPEIKYPPGFPALLSVAYVRQKSDYSNRAALMLICWSALPVFLFLAQKYCGQFSLTRRTAVLPVLVIASQAAVVDGSLTVLSDLWGAVWILAALLATESEGLDARPLLGGAGIGMLTVMAIMTRLAAFPLLAAIGVSLLLRRRYSSAAAMAVVVVPSIAAWLAWCFANRVPGTDYNDFFYSSYLGQLRTGLSHASASELMSDKLTSLFNNTIVPVPNQS